MIKLACQDFVNSYYGTHGEVDFSYYDRQESFDFGIDEGYFGYKDDELHIVVQGTDENLEWRGDEKSNFRFIHKMTDQHHGGNRKIKIHSGFFNAYETGRDMFLDTVKKYNKVFVKGHSRGGAIATLCARDIKYHFPEIDITLITGGSPRVYNFAGANEFDKCGIKSYRLVYRNDIVSRVPWNVFGYKHVGKLIWLGKPFILSPVGLPWDHYPEKYLQAIKNCNIII